MLSLKEKVFQSGRVGSKAAVKRKEERRTRTGTETKECKDRQRQVEKIGETSGSKVRARSPGGRVRCPTWRSSSPLPRHCLTSLRVQPKPQLPSNWAGLRPPRRPPHFCRLGRTRALGLERGPGHVGRGRCSVDSGRFRLARGRSSWLPAGRTPPH